SSVCTGSARRLGSRSGWPRRASGAPKPRRPPRRNSTSLDGLAPKTASLLAECRGGDLEISRQLAERHHESRAQDLMESPKISTAPFAVTRRTYWRHVLQCHAVYQRGRGRLG